MHNLTINEDPLVVEENASGGTKEAGDKPSVGEQLTPLSPSKVPKEPEQEASKSEGTTEEPSTMDTTTKTVSEKPKLFVVETHHETEEVIDRLLDVKGLEKGVSGLWGWMSGGVSMVTEQAAKVAEKASQEAKIIAEKANQQASIVAEKATIQANLVAEKAAQAKALATQQATELAATMTKTMEDKTSSSSDPSSDPPSITIVALPWESAHPARRSEARERVLKLSMDDQTFTVPPPKEASFKYDAVTREPYASRMLDTDALLSAKRFKLVPKVVDEHDFWRNYFYRVDLILNALGVPAPVVATDAQQSPKLNSQSNEIAQESTSNADWEEEMRKEIAAAEASHLDDSVKEDENFDMLEDDLEFDEDDGELENSIKEDLRL